MKPGFTNCKWCKHCQYHKKTDEYDIGFHHCVKYIHLLCDYTFPMYCKILEQHYEQEKNKKDEQDR